jgi:hypothetical protein
MLGSGFPLFFDLFKFLILFTIFLAAVSVYALFDNHSAGNLAENDGDSDLDWILRCSIAAHGTSSTPSVAQPWLISISIILMNVGYFVLTLRHRAINKRIDFDLVTPSDYTLFMS